MGRRFLAAQEDAAGALVLRVQPRKRAQQPPEVAARSHRPPGAGHGFGPVAAKLHLLLAGESGRRRTWDEQRPEIAALASKLVAAGRGQRDPVARLADRRSPGRVAALPWTDRPPYATQPSMQRMAERPAGDDGAAQVDACVR